MIDLIYIPGVDSHQLRMKAFPLSLADDAQKWWINEGDGKITIWEELVEKIFCKFYPESYDGEEEMLDEGDNLGIDPLEFISRINSSFDKHMKIDGRTKKIFKDMDQDSAHMVATSKVSMLKPSEYEIWRMMIEQYIQMIDYVLWDEVSPKSKNDMPLRDK
ncbi:hypothetical protein Tco_0835854 [Tanacetum coccineum]